MAWDPQQYLAFDQPRLRPAVDLLGRVEAEAPELVLDLGCGAGNVTALLAERWPGARVVGVDRSAEMLAVARAAHPGIGWVEADLAAWDPPGPAGVVFSNAVLHWLDGHEALLPHLLGWLAPGGWLAVQMPDNHGAPAHRAISAAAEEGPWADRLAPLLRRTPIAAPAAYHDLLVPHAASVDVWQTTYLHVLDGPDPVLEWVKGAVLRPLLAALDPDEQEAFLADCGTGLRAAYPPSGDGKTRFPFRRLFIVARR